MKMKIAVYGGTNLSSELISFVTALTKHLSANTNVIIVSGGFDHYIKHPGRRSVDRIVMETAKKIMSPHDFKNRFETWVPKYNDRKNVKRFKEGKVIEIHGSTQARRFNLVQHVDAIITIAGEGNTQSIIELALAIDKPVLPLAFTGGDSEKMWNMYRDDMLNTLNRRKLDFQVNLLPVSFQKIDTLGKKIADFMIMVSKRTCLVLMPFKRSGNNFYDNYLKKAIIQKGFTDYRIDRNEPAGNIPELFKTSLEKARAVIVDITGYNANVMYELGHVHAKNIKPLIIIRDSYGKTSTINDLPFYIKQEMIIRGNDTERGYAKIKLAVEKFLKLLH